MKKVIGYIVIAILVLFAGVAIFQLSSYSRRINDYKAKIDYFDGVIKDLKKRNENLNQQLNQANTQIGELRTKLGKKEVVEVPASCKECFENYTYKVTVEDKNGFWRYTDPNVFDSVPGTLQLTDKFYAHYLNPCLEKLQECQEELKKSGKPSLKEHFSFLHPELYVGWGVTGIYAGADYWFLEVGKKTKLGIGVNGYVTLQPDGSVFYNAGIGIRVRF